MKRDESGRFVPRQQQRRRGNGGGGGSSSSASIYEPESRPWGQQYASEGPCAEAARHTGVATTLGVVAGAGLGAALMFLLDPEQGRRRRERIAHATSTALESTTEAAKHAWEAGTEKAIEGAAALYAATPSRKDLRRGRHRLADRLGSAFGSAADSTRETASDWLESAKEHLPSLPHRRSRRHDYDVSPTTAGVGAAGALLLGLGAMWLFDPDRGRGRRAWIGQKTNRLLNETGRFMRATGRHLANRSRGYYFESRKAVAGAGHALTDSSIAESVRSALGRLGLRSSSSVGVECLGGCVTLTGRCVADDVDTVIRTTRETYGVDNVVNNMEVSDRFDSPTSSAPTSL